MNEFLDIRPRARNVKEMLGFEPAAGGRTVFFLLLGPAEARGGPNMKESLDIWPRARNMKEMLGFEPAAAGRTFFLTFGPC